MHKLTLYTSSALLVLAGLGISFSATANSPSGPGITARMPAQDLGPTVASNIITTSIYLNMGAEKRAELAAFIKATVTPGNPQYRKFLTVAQFRDGFAPSSEKIQQLVAYLNSHGIRVSGIDPDGLGFTATGSVAQFDGAFSTQIHDFVRNGQRFHRPVMKPVAPAEFADLLLSMPGLSSEPGRFRPKNVRLGQGAFANIKPPVWNEVRRPGAGTASGIPGEYTVGDVANFYQVNPLYQAHNLGGGRSIGIMTLANFNMVDAYAYWSDIGLSVKSNRIQKVLVDGGILITCQPPSNPFPCGSDETSLDVEQSGGLAPNANIQVYIAPNTNQGFIDLFKVAVNTNWAGTLSISWGEPEVYYFAAFNGGTDYTDQLVTIDQYLMQGAAQGQSIFTAAGDSGAYDTVRSAGSLGGPGFDPLSVDYPSSDPYITSAGGTTTPVFLDFGSAGTVNITSEQVWGWDYLEGVCSALGFDPISCGIYSSGGGGGVSVYWPVPAYQQYVQGITLSQPGQSFVDADFFGTSVNYSFPPNYAGRNTPDLSLNADPETGYIVVDCIDFPEPANPGCVATGYGGTSFVAPQLNGITTLVNQAVGSRRVGFLNPSIYLMQQLYGSGPPSPFNYIYNGDNWFYCGAYCFEDSAYGNGVGIGTINAGDLALAFGWKPPYVVQSMLQKH
ncbi:MAG: S53 family peptidase [Gammaproteobacteria bacterium]